MSFNINLMKMQLNQLNLESKHIKPEEGLERLNQIAMQILYVEEAESTQMQNVLRQIEALDEKFRVNSQPYCFVASITRISTPNNFFAFPRIRRK